MRLDHEEDTLLNETQMDRERNFLLALNELRLLDKHIYFMYGSAALDARFEKPFFGNGRSAYGDMRFVDEGGNLETGLSCVDTYDIDLAFFSDEISWDEIVNIARNVRKASRGQYILDPHYVEVVGENIRLYDAMVPRDWITTTEFPPGISILDPAPALLLRCASGRVRPKDIRRIAVEIQLMGDSLTKDIRVAAGLRLIWDRYSKDPKALAFFTAQFCVKLLPESTYRIFQEQFHRIIPVPPKYPNIYPPMVPRYL